MKIDYICFTVPDNEHTDFEVSTNDSEIVKDIKRNDAKLFKDASKNNMAIVYDRKMHRFLKNNSPVNLRGKTVFYRGNVFFQADIVRRLEKEGAYPLQKARDSYVIRDWPDYTQPAHRTIYRTTFAEFAENYEDYQDMFEVLHIKSVEGNKANKVLCVFGNKEGKDGNPEFFTKPKVYLEPEDEVFLTETFAKIDDPENQEPGREYRAFVTGGELLSISRSFVKEKVEVPNDVIDATKRIILKNNKIPLFPKTYAVDVAEMMIDEKRVIDVVTYKNPCCAELSIGHDLVKEIISSSEEEMQ